MNKILLVGRLTRDPETRYSQSQDEFAITRFTVAVERRYSRDGETNVDFINCVAFSKTAEFVNRYFTKGMKIGLCGRLQNSTYTNQKGEKTTKAEVVVDEVEFVESKKAFEASSYNTSSKTQSNSYKSGYNSGYNNQNNQNQKQKSYSTSTYDTSYDTDDFFSDDDLPF